MSRFNYLLEGYLSARLQPAELQEFLSLLGSNEQAIDQVIAECLASGQFAGSGDPEIEQRIYDQILKRQQTPVVSLRRRGLLRTAWLRYTAAAILLLGIGVYFWWQQVKPANELPVIVQGKDVTAPASSKAVLTLSNGQQIIIDSAGNGMLATQGATNIVKLTDGQLVYNSASLPQGELLYNTLNNPRGSKVINMTLADGSRVWLNAGSSVTYPVAFTGNERKVSITGEAYFEVAHNASKPFFVSKGTMQVEVLGTHFNVNAYDDEDAIKVTLLEGSVRVTQNLSSSVGNAERLTLKPGEQAILTTNNDLSRPVGKPQTTNPSERFIRAGNIDLDQTIAWTTGFFQFDNLDIQTILRQLSRWYNVDVSYETAITQRRFGGRISNQLNLSEILRLLEANNIHFRLDGRKIIVLP